MYMPLFGFKKKNKKNEKQFVVFVERTISVTLPNPVTQPDFFQLVKTY